MKPKIITEKISKEELAEITKENFGDMVKVDVDIERGILAIGGEWHSEGEDLLVKDGSLSKDVWGINFYPWNKFDERIEYVSLINIKPSFGHKKMKIDDEKIKEKIKSVIQKLLLNDDETVNV